MFDLLGQNSPYCTITALSMQYAAKILVTLVKLFNIFLPFIVWYMVATRIANTSQDNRLVYRLN